MRLFFIAASDIKSAHCGVLKVAQAGGRKD